MRITGLANSIVSFPLLELTVNTPYSFSFTLGLAVSPLRPTGLTIPSPTTLGGSISETEIVKKMLQVVPNHLEQVAISIETLLDMNNLTVEEVTKNLIGACAGKRQIKRRSRLMTGQSSARTVGREVT